jgi:hypothetical protein
MPTAKVLYVTRGIAEAAQIGAAREVEHAPQRLPRGAYDDCSPGHARDFGESLCGVRQVLEDLATDDEIEACIVERQLGDRAATQLDERVESWIDRAEVSIRRDEPSRSRSVREQVLREPALTASHLEDAR